MQSAQNFHDFHHDKNLKSYYLSLINVRDSYIIF